MRDDEAAHPRRVDYSIAEACRVLAIGREMLFGLIKDGRIMCYGEGDDLTIDRGSVQRFIASLPRA